MRSFFGSILLILVLAALGATIYYHWSTNSHLNLNSATPTNRKKRYRSSTWKNGRQPCRLFRGKNSSFPRGRNSRFRCRNAGTRGIIIPPVAAL